MPAASVHPAQSHWHHGSLVGSLCGRKPGLGSVEIRMGELILSQFSFIYMDDLQQDDDIQPWTNKARETQQIV